jgi:hypothetical protein
MDRVTPKTTTAFRKTEGASIAEPNQRESKEANQQTDTEHPPFPSAIAASQGCGIADSWNHRID